MIEAVVFDLDGVIIDSEPVWEQARRQVVAEHGGHWAADAQQRLMGMSTGEWARYLSEDLGVGLPPDQVAALVIERMAARYTEQLPLMAGAVAAVRGLAECWPLGLASSSPRSLIGTRLDAAGLRVIAVPHPRYPPDPGALAAAALVLTGLGQLTPAAVAALGS
jgi:beta-phosphoglucomutase-like phosphatase (HAD superfamily)